MLKGKREQYKEEYPPQLNHYHQLRVPLISLLQVLIILLLLLLLLLFLLFSIITVIIYHHLTVWCLGWTCDYPYDFRQANYVVSRLFAVATASNVKCHIFENIKIFRNHGKNEIKKEWDGNKACTKVQMTKDAQIINKYKENK